MSNLHTILSLADLLFTDVKSVQGIGSATVLTLADGSQLTYLPNHGASPAPDFFKRQTPAKPKKKYRRRTNGQFAPRKVILVFMYKGDNDWQYRQREIELVRASVDGQYYEGIERNQSERHQGFKRFATKNIMPNSFGSYFED